MKGDHSAEVIKAVHHRKAKKIGFILNSRDNELMKITKGTMKLPAEAEIYPSLTCALCGEKVMEPRARVKEGKMVCMPCFEKRNE